MIESLYKAHENCEMVVNYDRCNTHGRPSLCCATCTDKKGRPQWIDWISREYEDYYIEALCCEVIEPEPYSGSLIEALKQSSKSKQTP